MPATTASVHHHGLLHSDLPEASNRSFLEGYECLMQEDSERLYALTVTTGELDILTTDDRGLSSNRPNMEILVPDWLITSDVT